MGRSELHTDHPLFKLRGRCINEYTLEVEAWPGRFVGQAEFVLYLKDAGWALSDRPVLEGLYGRTKIPGSQGEVERGILDVRIAPLAAFGSRDVRLQGGEVEQGIVEAVCETIAGTWSAMMYLAYGWKTLKQIHELRHPVQVTDEGYLLFRHGFRGGWKDYYYSEGWWEGPTKLKAERPPTAEYGSLWDAENARVLLDFLKRTPTEGLIHFREEGSHEMVVLPIVVLERDARSRALRMLRELSGVDADLLHERDRVLTVYPSPESLGELDPADLESLAVKVAASP
ncbi:MAG: DUF1122 family protein [Candidatus Methylomirabilales bacterium]